MRRFRFVLLMLLTACGGGGNPPVTTVPAPVPAPAPAAEATSSAPVRVTAGALNVRRDPSATAEVLTQVKRGVILTRLSTTGDWSRVSLPDGTIGWVASQHVTRDVEQPARASTARRRGNCPPDSDFRFATPPKPSFTENSGKPGLVVIDVSVSAAGKVLSARVVSNTTGEPALAELAEREIRNATFVAPVRNCAPKPFIYSYKRSF